MATNTTNLNLIKPAGSERVQISQINQNMDILDEKIGAVGNTSVQSQITATNGLIDSLKNQVAILQTFSGDCNDITETCVVYVTDAATHSPDNWSIMTTYVFDASNAIWQAGMNVINGTMKVRHKNGNGWSAWTSQVLQTIIVTSVSNLQATLLAKAQTMGSEGIENIKIIFNGSNEGVFANGNYYCGWIAINSAGSNWLYFSGVLKGLYGADTIEFTYTNGTWSFYKLSEKNWYADHDSKTTYSLPLDGLTTGAYWMAQMYIQTGTGSCGVYIVFMDTSSNVEVTKVSGNSAITFTGARNGNFITLTASDTVWGGIRATTMN